MRYCYHYCIYLVRESGTQSYIDGMMLLENKVASTEAHSKARSLIAKECGLPYGGFTILSLNYLGEEE